MNKDDIIWYSGHAKVSELRSYLQVAKKNISIIDQPGTSKGLIVNKNSNGYDTITEDKDFVDKIHINTSYGPNS